MKEVAPMLAQSGEVGAGDAEGISTFECAKATGDLLLQFWHPNIALGLVVIKRTPQVMEKAQHIARLSAQASEQIHRSRLFDPSAPALDARCCVVEPLAPARIAA